MYSKIIEAVVAIVLVAVGINLYVVVDIGYGPLDTMAKLAQALLDIQKFGDAQFLMHALFGLILLIYYIIKRKNISFIILSFLAIFIITRVINLFSFIGDIGTQGIFMTAIIFAVGFSLFALGLILMSRANLIITPYDKFVVEVAEVRKKEIGRVRIAIDTSVLILAFILSKLLQIELAFSIGTLLLTFGTGYLMSLFDMLIIRIKKVKKIDI